MLRMEALRLMLHFIPKVRAVKTIRRVQVRVIIPIVNLHHIIIEIRSAAVPYFLGALKVNTWSLALEKWKAEQNKDRWHANHGRPIHSDDKPVPTGCP